MKILLLILFSYSLTFSQMTSEVLSDGLVLKLKSNNRIIASDPVAASILSAIWKTPSEGMRFLINNEVVGVWENIKADSAGWFINDSLTNAYVSILYTSDVDKVVLLEAMGNTMVYVNGVPRSGNPYRYKDTYESWEPRFDYSLLPVKLKKGQNKLLFQCNRGVLKVKLNTAPEELMLNKEDLTLPDLIINESADTYGAIPVINTSEIEYKGLFIKTWTDSSSPVYHSIESIQPLSVYKAPFQIRIPAQRKKGNINLHIVIVRKEKREDEVLASDILELKVVEPGDVRKETFISRMDGSVQYYGVNPPVNLKNKAALFLSLHGAGVEAINQAGSYGHKNWGYIIAPTNRRPFGFNWENWGRLDALEVLETAKKKYKTDEEKVYLTGHSMGGHGTWHLGINYPDKFAAIGPSAGWISIWSYRIRPDVDTTEVTGMLLRSTKQSDTYAFAENLKSNGIYIVHGDKDDNVPPEQSHSMINVLKEFHRDYVYHEEPGAGHWWDNSDEPGADCVDWAPMFEFFSRHSLPSKNVKKEIDYTTANLSVSSENYWIKIIQQTEQQKLSRIKIRFEQGKKTLTGNTQNIRLLEIDCREFSVDTVSIKLDSSILNIIPLQAYGKIYLLKEGENWNITEPYKLTNKYPGRCGNIREVLNNDVVFVYGTSGNKEENEWAYNKARYDAERLWYQGNGSIELIKDSEYDPVKYGERNVIIFGNSETNLAWDKLLNKSEINLTRKKVQFGKKEFVGDDISCLLILPRSESNTASVAVIGGTGIKGMKLAGLPMYHHPYVNFPDVIIYNSNVIKSDDEGVITTGYFGNDWSIENGEFVGK